MWPFKKKYPALDSPTDNERWTVAQGNFNGAPMIVRINDSARKYSKHPELPVRLGIAIPLHHPDARGFPNNDEAKQLTEIEDRLCAALHGNGRLVVVVTGKSMREFVSYVRSTGFAEKSATNLRAKTTLHEVQHYVCADPEWTGFKQFGV